MVLIVSVLYSLKKNELNQLKKFLENLDYNYLFIHEQTPNKFVVSFKSYLKIILSKLGIIDDRYLFWGKLRNINFYLKLFNKPYKVFRLNDDFQKIKRGFLDKCRITRNNSNTLVIYKR